VPLIEEKIFSQRAQRTLRKNKDWKSGMSRLALTKPLFIFLSVLCALCEKIFSSSGVGRVEEVASAQRLKYDEGA
jgi:hypothetical protein